MNIYWAVLLQFLGDEHIKWFYIVAATPWFSSATPKFASAGCRRRDLVFAGGFLDTNKAWCWWRYFSLQNCKEHQALMFFLRISLLFAEQRKALIWRWGTNMPVQSIVPFGMVLRNFAGCQYVRSSNSFAAGLGNLTSCQHCNGGRQA